MKDRPKPRHSRCGHLLLSSQSIYQQRNAARDGGRTGRLIEILTLQAVALQIHGQQDQALAALEHALSLAEPEGYVRIFVDEGIAMSQLLTEASAQNMSSAFIDKILTLFAIVEKGIDQKR